jgi:hypothetical protein
VTLVDAITVTAHLIRVEFVRQDGGSANVAKAYVVLRDDADDRRIKVAVPRAFAQKLADYLAEWDEADGDPPLDLTFTIPPEPDP